MQPSGLPRSGTPRGFLVLVLLLSISACVGSPSSKSPQPHITGAPTAVDPWANGTALTILDAGSGGAEFDVECLSGGVLLPREAPRVANGTHHLDAKVSADATFSGLQLGYTFDGNGAPDERSAQPSIQWFAPVSGASKRFSIPVTPDQWENETTRWQFYARMNLPAAPQDCYTGGGIGSWEALVSAVRNPA